MYNIHQPLRQEEVGRRKKKVLYIAAIEIFDVWATNNGR
jgi:hypothetical protein